MLKTTSFFLFMLLALSIQQLFGQQTERRLYPIKLKSEIGYIDKTGKFIIEPQFDDAVEFREGLAAVELNGKRGFIDESGKFVISLQFDKWVYWFENGISEIRVGGKTGYIDKSGNFIWVPSN